MVVNFSLFFVLHLAGFFGFRIHDEYGDQRNFLDLKEGTFVKEKPSHPYFLEGLNSFASSQILKMMRPEELVQLDLNQDIRRILLQAFQQYYALHVPDFGTMKTFPVLQTILSE
jgi:DNA repair protein RecO (recombination protein O)